MSSYSRRFALTAPLALAACGFEPVFAPGGSGTALQNAVLVAAPQNQNGFLLVRRIEERLGRPSPARYTLSLTLSTRAQGLETDPAGNTNRFNVIGIAGYVLTDAETGVQISSGTVNSFTGYSATDSTVAAQAARRDAIERLMVILADQITTRLLATPLPA